MSHDILDNNNVYNYNVNREYDAFPWGKVWGKESFVSHSIEGWKSPRSGLDISGA
jgi:hypothetical protein